VNWRKKITSERVEAKDSIFDKRKIHVRMKRYERPMGVIGKGEKMTRHD